MALELPSAPANFYSPSLSTLKAAMEAVNGSTSGKVVLLSTIPTDIEDAWAEVGVAGDTVNNSNRGSLVIGHKDVGVITGPVLGPEGSPGENGYKLQFAAVDQVPIYIDGSGIATSPVVGFALVIGVDNYANGTVDHLKYIFKLNNIVLTDGGLINLPAVELIINFAEEQ